MAHLALAATIPDGQLEAFDVYLGNSNASEADRVTAVGVWLQRMVDQELWNMVRKDAVESVSDPTV
jgi:hypothetical protein